MRILVLLLMVAGVCLGLKRVPRAELDFSSGEEISFNPGTFRDIPSNDVSLSDLPIRVVSSPIRIRPREKKIRTKRQAKYRKPRMENIEKEDLKNNNQGLKGGVHKTLKVPLANDHLKTQKDTSKEQMDVTKGLTTAHTKSKAIHHLSDYLTKRDKRQKSLTKHSNKHPREKNAAHLKPHGTKSLEKQSNTHPREELTTHLDPHDTKSVQKEQPRNSHAETSKRHRQQKYVPKDETRHHHTSRSAKKLDKLHPNKPEKKKSPRRQKRETIQSYRRPREFQFITNKMDRLSPPPIVMVYPPGQRDERVLDRSFRKSQRRIIYYANLPEIVRPPVQWYPPSDYFYSRQPYASPSTTVYSSPSTIYSSPSNNYPSATPFSSSSSLLPSPSENEITRVQSNIIDVTNSPRFPTYTSTPKFTIIDVEPPYYTNSFNRHPVRVDSNHYPPSRFYDIRTPPFRDHSRFSSQHFRPEPSLEPVKLQTPSPESATSSTSTESPSNSTRFIPDALPVNLRSLSKFVT